MREIQRAQDFAEHVVQSTVPTVVKFYKDGCATCRNIHPLLTQLAQEFSDRVQFAAVEVTNKNLVGIAYKRGLLMLPHHEWLTVEGDNKMTKDSDLEPIKEDLKKRINELISTPLKR